MRSESIRWTLPFRAAGMDVHFSQSSRACSNLPPLSMEEIRGKYEPLAKRIFSGKRMREIEKRIMSLEKANDFSKIADFLGKEGGKR